MLDATRQFVPTAAMMAAGIPGAGELVTVFIWFAVAALAAVGGIYLIRAVRKWSQREQRTASFTIQDLREMRARGEITEQEFAAMRSTILAQLGPHSAEPPPPRPAAQDAHPEDGPPSPP